jgi:hypothetical protein
MEMSGLLQASTALPRKYSPGTHWTGGWGGGGSEPVLMRWQREKNSLHRPAGNWTPVAQPVTYTDRATPAPVVENLLMKFYSTLSKLTSLLTIKEY